MKTTILIRENESASIEKLAAQRYLYSHAKVIFYIQIFISVLAIALLSFTQLLFPKVDMTLLIATISVAAVVADNLFDNYIDRLKEKASKIQEYFDVYVLQIKWNEILCGEMPEHSEIFHYASKKSVSNQFIKLKNWYPSAIQNVPEEVGTLIAQKTNCNYDADIRKRYKNRILFFGIFTILVITTFTIFNDITISKIILTVIFPAAPIFQWMQKNILRVNQSIENLTRLNSLINSSWQKLIAGHGVKENEIRMIQDGIFLNRKDSPLIPDFIYNRLWNKLEKQMRYSVEQLTSEYNSK